MKLLRTNRGRWYLLVSVWVLVLILGAGGFVQQGHEGGIKRGTLDVVYLTMKLANLSYDGSSAGPMNWRVNIARFVVPIMAASTLFQAATVVFSEEFKRWRARRSTGHTVVVGLGDVGIRMAKALVATGVQVVAVDKDPATVASAQRTLTKAVPVLVGDATEAELLHSVRVDRADRLVIAAGEDARNVAIADVASTICQEHRGSKKALRCAIQLHDAELTGLLRAADLDSGTDIRITFFSLHERAARFLLTEHAPFVDGPNRPLVIGLGQFGRSLVVALAQMWASDHPDERLHLTLVDPNAEGRWAELRHRHPALDDVCLPELIDLDLGQPSADGLDAFAEMLHEDQPTWVAIVVEDEALALANAVFLHQQLPRGAVPIVVRMRSSTGLGTLLDPVSGSNQSFPGVEVFPFLDRTCTVLSLDGGIREQLARAVHEDYLNHLPPDAPMTPLHRAWADLDDDQRDDSRRRVDGIVGDLASIGCELAPLRRWGAPALVLTDAEEDQLAAREHQRWFDDRTSAGWRWGETRDDSAKTNPLLVPWTELPLEAQASNLEGIKDLQPMLARAGFEIVRAADFTPEPTTDPSAADSSAADSSASSAPSAPSNGTSGSNGSSSSSSSASSTDLPSRSANAPTHG